METKRELLNETGRDDAMYEDYAYGIDEKTGEFFDLVDGYVMEQWDNIYVVVGREGSALAMGEDVFNKHFELFEALGCYCYRQTAWLGDAEDLDNAIDRAIAEAKTH